MDGARTFQSGVEDSGAVAKHFENDVLLSDSGAKCF